MSNRASIDFTLPRMQYGTHQIAWDLRVLLYKGAAATRRNDVAERIDKGDFGRMLRDRIPLVRKLHGAIAAKLERGAAQSSLVDQLQALWTFVAWVDEADEILTLNRSTQVLRAWTELLLHRARIVKDLSDRSAYSYAAAVADLLARAQDLPQRNPGAALLRLTRMRHHRSKKGVLGTKADQQNLERTFRFGHFLADLCIGLDAGVVRGRLPVTISLRNGRSLMIAGGLRNPGLDPMTIKNPAKRAQAIRSRAPLHEGVSAFDDLKRSKLLNIRVEAELLIFLAQTGMNLGQASKLRRETYRWQTDGEDLKAYRVYKGRRGGEAVFRCFRAYRAHWERYLAWLHKSGLFEANDNLFPFLYPGKIPASHVHPKFKGVRDTVRSLGITYIGPRSLRKTRINWLLRRSRDPDLTAEQAAHSKETLLNSYEQPHHQSAAVEILRFHKATDPTFLSPGPGICADNTRRPAALPETPAEAPHPDCISPDGCMFCIHHRDVMSADYCWKLASHARLKALEVVLYKPSKSNLIHPANRVIDRIHDKLRAIGDGSAVRAQWVRDAQDAIRAGSYHSLWQGYIQLLEVLT